MTKQQAISIVQQAISAFKGTKQDHIMIEQAFNAILTNTYKEEVKKEIKEETTENKEENTEETKTIEKESE